MILVGNQGGGAKHLAQHRLKEVLAVPVVGFTCRGRLRHPTAGAAIAHQCGDFIFDFRLGRGLGAFIWSAGVVQPRIVTQSLRDDINVWKFLVSPHAAHRSCFFERQRHVFRVTGKG